MKKLLIFDAYGTLLSTGTGSVDAAAKILSLQEKKISPAIFYARWKELHRLHLDLANAGEFRLEADVFADDLQALYWEYGIGRPYREDVSIMLRSLTGRKAFSEVKQTIEALRKRYRLVVGSTTDTAPLLADLTANGLCFDMVYTSEMIKKYKPHRDFYRYILERENVSPKEVAFIGDSLLDDVKGPQSIGIDAVWVNRKNLPFTGSVRPTYEVNCLSELLTINFL